MKAGWAAAAALFVVATMVEAKAPLTLPPVGPDRAVSDARTGLLVVFSSPETGLLSTHLPDNSRPHSDYALQLGDGTPLRTVDNRSGALGGDPEAVILPAGSYRIVARANGYGRVVVPVIVGVGETTTVHLEGGAPNPASFASRADQVRLPDGRVVGWRADHPSK
ncbi:MAG TPA: hypothetical protein VGM73_08915 [Candidatus Didemnitutus sp.]